MRGFRAFLDWLPTLLASTTVFAKLLAMAAFGSGSLITAPLLAFAVGDVLPITLARAAARLFFDTRGIGPSGAQMLFSHVAMLVLTAAQWYVVGAVIRRWLFSRETTAVTTRFR